MTSIIIYSLSGCQSKCEATMDCVGMEYSYGRCEIWTRFHGLYAVQEIPGSPKG